MHNENLANTAINVEHKQHGDEIKNGKYALSQSNVGTRVSHTIQYHEEVYKPSRIAATHHHN